MSVLYLMSAFCSLKVLSTVYMKDFVYEEINSIKHFHLNFLVFHSFSNITTRDYGAEKITCITITNDTYTVGLYVCVHACTVKLQINVSILWHDEFSKDGHNSN
jgi:hypothetical protein